MFAVIKTGGKQYKVQEGESLQVEKLNREKGKPVVFDLVLLIESDQKTMIGTPFIEKAEVRAVVLENLKSDKITVFKKKRRKQYKKTRGHRQNLTLVRIEKIIAGEKAVKPDKKEENKLKPEKTEKSKAAAPKKATPYKKDEKVKKAEKTTRPSEKKQIKKEAGEKVEKKTQRKSKPGPKKKETATQKKKAATTQKKSVKKSKGSGKKKKVSEES